MIWNQEGNKGLSGLSVGKDFQPDILTHKDSALPSRGGHCTGEQWQGFAMGKEQDGIRSWCKESFSVFQPDADAILEK